MKRSEMQTKVPRADIPIQVMPQAQATLASEKDQGATFVVVLVRPTNREKPTPISQAERENPMVNVLLVTSRPPSTTSPFSIYERAFPTPVWCVPAPQ